MDFADDGTVADHAYWLGPPPPRLRRSGSLGRDRRGLGGVGKGDPAAKATQHTAGTLNGGNVGPLTYAETSKGWGPSRSAPKHDALKIDATNLAEATVNVKRARLDCAAKLDVTTDGPLAVRLAGCGRTLHFGR